MKGVDIKFDEVGRRYVEYGAPRFTRVIPVISGSSAVDIDEKSPPAIIPKHRL